MNPFKTCIYSLLGVLSLTSTTLLADTHAGSGTLSDIKAKKELKIGVDPGFIPFEMKTPDGKWVGFDVDMMNAFSKELGVTAKFVDTKWEGIIPSLLAKKFDVIVSGMTITPERSQVIAFSDPYYRAGLVVMLSNKSAEKVKTSADLNKAGVTIVVKLGTTADMYTAKTFPKAKIVKLDSESDAASALLLGKFDAFVYDKPYLELYARRNAGKVKLLSDLMTTEDFGLAARKKDTTLVASFNDFLKRWRASGEYDKSIKSNFVDMPWLKFFPDLK